MDEIGAAHTNFVAKFLLLKLEHVKSGLTAHTKFHS